MGTDYFYYFKKVSITFGEERYATNDAMERHAVAICRKHRKSDYQDILEKIALEICRKFEINENSLFSKGRRNSISQAREQFCFRAYYKEKLLLSVIARFLGITITPVSFLARRGMEKNS